MVFAQKPGLFIQKYRKSLTPHGTLIVKQYFPKIQNYGQGIINGVEGFRAFMNSSISWKKDIEIEITTTDPNGVVILCTYNKS